MTSYEGASEFDKLLSGHGEIDLVHFMLEVAADAYPHLDRVGCLLEIDRLGVACADAQANRPTYSVRQRLEAISRQLYEVEGFHGNCKAYYDPRNSYLNKVLKRRCGIPISLGILYMAVAARNGLNMFGVNTPGHFFVGCCCGGGDVLYVDPFTNGDILDREGCKLRVDQALGQQDAASDEHFRAAEPLEIAARVLRNLKAAHATKNHWPHVLTVQRRLAALLPHVPQEQRDLGLVYLRLGEAAKALPVLEHYASECDSQQALELGPSIRTARRMLAELN